MAMRTKKRVFSPILGPNPSDPEGLVGLSLMRDVGRY